MLAAKSILGSQDKFWTDTTIRRRVTCGPGNLNSELFVGRLIWRPVCYVKGPGTRKRVLMLGPKLDWIALGVPDFALSTTCSGTGPSNVSGPSSGGWKRNPTRSS